MPKSFWETLGGNTDSASLSAEQLLLRFREQAYLTFYKEKYVLYIKMLETMKTVGNLK